MVSSVSIPEAVRRWITTPRELLDTLGHYVALKQVGLFILLSRKLEMQVCTLAGLWELSAHHKQGGEGRLMVEEATCCQSRLLVSADLSRGAPRPSAAVWRQRSHSGFNGPPSHLVEAGEGWRNFWVISSKVICVYPDLAPTAPTPLQICFHGIILLLFLVALMSIVFKFLSING